MSLDSDQPIRINLTPHFSPFPGERAYSDDHPLNITPEERLLTLLLPGQTYAWGKTARYICEQALDTATQNTSGRFVAVDLCSATPIWPEIMKEIHFEDCYSQAVRTVSEATYKLQWEQQRLPETERIPIMDNLDSDTRNALIQTITPRRSNARVLLQAALQEILFNPPPTTDTENLTSMEEDVQERLVRCLEYSLVSFDKIFEREEFVGKGRWQIYVERVNANTFYEIVTDLIGEEKSKKFLFDITRFLSRKISPLLRRHSVLSLDIMPRKQILLDAGNSFPEDFRKTVFFLRATSFRDHVTANTLALPFRNESISFYSSIEGYPYYLPKTPFVTQAPTNSPFYPGHPLDHQTFAEDIYRTLKPGGIAIFAPFAFPATRYSTSNKLLDLANYWRDKGMIVTEQTYSLEKLKKQMGDRELLLTSASPVFRDHRRKYLHVLVVEKPRSLHY